MDNAFSINHNANTSMSNLASASKLNEKLNKHTFSESTIQFQNEFKIILDEVRFINKFCFLNNQSEIKT